MLAQLRKQFAYPGPALAMPLELIRCAEQFRMAFDEREPLVLEQIIRARLHVHLDQLGLVIEQVVLRWSAGHVQVDYAPGFWQAVRLPRRHRVVVTSPKRQRGGGASTIASQQSGQGNCAD